METGFSTVDRLPFPFFLKSPNITSAKSTRGTALTEGDTFLRFALTESPFSMDGKSVFFCAVTEKAFQMKKKMRINGSSLIFNLFQLCWKVANINLKPLIPFFFIYLINKI